MKSNKLNILELWKHYKTIYQFFPKFLFFLDAGARYNKKKKKLGAGGEAEEDEYKPNNQIISNYVGSLDLMDF